MNTLIHLTILGSLVYAAILDFTQRRIPNRVVGFVLVVSLLSLAINHDLSNVFYGLLFGLVVGFAFYFLNIWGAGDVKLFAILSSAVGIFNFFNFFYFVLISGGLLSLAYIIYSLNEQQATGANFLSRLKISFKHDIPYGVAILCGYVLQLVVK